MHVLTLAYLTTCSVLIPSTPCMGDKLLDTYRILENFKGAGYLSDVVPVPPEGAHSVEMSFALVSLDEVNEKDQKMVTTGRLQLSWTDRLLAWNASDFGNVSTVLMNQDNLWLPDVTVANSIVIASHLGFKELSCRVYANGTVIWRPTTILHTSCSIDITYFPFDTQICYIVFETYMTKASEVKIKLNTSSSLVLDEYHVNGQWKLIETGSYARVKVDGENQIVLAFILSRRKAFYMLAVMVPVLLLSLVGTLAFALPADVGGKMNIGFSALLAYAVHLNVVYGQLPNTSLQTSILSVYLTTLMGITAACVMMSAVVLRVHHKPDSVKVGPKTRTLVKVLQMVTFSERPSHGAKTASPNTVGPNATSRKSEESSKTDAFKKEKIATDARTPLKAVEGAEVKTPEMTWKEVAVAVDWFLFLLMTLISLLTTLVCLCLLLVKSELTKPGLSFPETF